MMHDTYLQLPPETALQYSHAFRMLNEMQRLCPSRDAEVERRAMLDLPEKVPCCNIGYYYNHPSSLDRPVCPACNGTCYLLTVIVVSIYRSFPRQADEILHTLRWSSDHYSFVRWGMYVGIETDGHIHS
jgi:hypothetical protein